MSETLHEARRGLGMGAAETPLRVQTRDGRTVVVGSPEWQANVKQAEERRAALIEIADERARARQEKPDLPFRIAAEILLDLDARGDIPWVVPDLVFGGGVTMLSGAPKKGKSTLLAQLVHARVTGEDWIGYQVRGGPILVLTEEGEYSFAIRWGRAATAAESNEVAFDAVILGDVVAEAKGMPAWEDILAGVEKWCDGLSSPLVVIDTLAMWAGIEDENDASQTTEAIALARSLAHRTRAAVILVHHTRKGGGQGGEAIRGSTALLATVDVSIEMRTMSEASSNRKLYVQTRVGPSGWESVVQFDRETLTYSQSMEDPKDALPTLREYAKRLPDPTDAPEGFEISSAIALWDVKRTTAQERIKAMLDKGVLREEKVKRGRVWVNVYHVIPAPHGRPSTEDDD